jgi:hypothetical protein
MGWPFLDEDVQNLMEYILSSRCGFITPMIVSNIRPLSQHTNFIYVFFISEDRGWARKVIYFHPNGILHIGDCGNNLDLLKSSCNNRVFPYPTRSGCRGKNVRFKTLPHSHNMV